MKKPLIALAALAATGAALAQSSVTVYGRLDLGISQQDTSLGARPSEDRASIIPRTERIDTLQDQYSLAGAQDEWTGSRLGFRGSEDLGSGLRAGFVWEMSLNADRVAGQADAGTRLAKLSLSGGFGSVVIGTFMNAFDTVRSFSPGSGGIPGGRATEWQAAPLTERFDSRSQNAIAYVAPTWGGLTASVGLLSNRDETRTLAGAAQPGGFNYNGFILGLGYTQGPLSAQLAYGNLDLGFHTGLAIPAGAVNSVGTLAAPVNTDVSNLALGLSYNLGRVILSFVYEDSSRDMVRAAPGRTALPGVERNMWEVGAQLPMGALAFFVTYGQGERTDINIHGVRFTDELSAFQFGTTYHFSRRTWLYAAFGEATRQFGRIDLREESGFSMGLVHSF